MNRKQFKQNLEKGKEWEELFYLDLKNRLSKSVTIIDNRNFYRDEKNRKIPDFTLIDSVKNKTVYYDAKSKSYYYTKNDLDEYVSLFTMDVSFVDSYRSISAETGSPVYISFWDKKKDKEHYYVLDVNQKEYDTYSYDNEFTINNRISYRWNIEDLKKIKISVDMS